MVLLLGCFYIALILLYFMYSYLRKKPFPCFTQMVHTANIMLCFLFGSTFGLLGNENKTNNEKVETKVNITRIQHWLLCKVWYAGFKQVGWPSWKHLLKSIQLIWRKCHIGYFPLHTFRSNDISITVQKSMYQLTITLFFSYTACILESRTWLPKQNLFFPHKLISQTFWPHRKASIP